MLDPNPKPNGKYLPNLDPLRFFAASVVLFYHVDNFLVLNNYKPDYLCFFPFQHGDIAVVAFFTLSGFLITHLLLEEKEKSKDIRIRVFYLKRVLRIWPLYFLVIIAAFAYFNNSTFFHIGGATSIVDIGKNLCFNVIMLILIAPNFTLLDTTSLGYATPAWSIGVEEQFYLLWPWIVKSKYFLKYLFLIIIAMNLLSHGLLLRFVGPLLHHGFLTEKTFLYKALFYTNKFFTFSFSFRIDAMALGALGAYLVFVKSRLLTTFYSKAFQLFLYLMLFFLLLFPHIVDYQFYAVIFTLIIINVATNPETVIVIKNRLLNYFGKISYGVYMFHLFTIFPVIKLITSVFGLPINLFSESFICIISLSLSIVIATISYYTFERFFLKYKLSLEKTLNNQIAH